VKFLRAGNKKKVNRDKITGLHGGCFGHWNSELLLFLQPSKMAFSR
jgi:hypothetical protein